MRRLPRRECAAVRRDSGGSSVGAVHPIEHLRFIARSSGADQRALVHESASALRALGDDPAGVVVSCRRILERHPSAGALWWFAATMLSASDPRAAAAAAAAEVTGDLTPDELAAALPDGATVCLVGWPDLIGDALVRRGDVTVLVVDTSRGGPASRGDATGRDLVRRLERAETPAELVDPAGISGAVQASDIVLVEALAASPGELLVAAGSRAAASIAYCSEVPVWGVVGVGRVLPATLFAASAELATAASRPWHASAETLPLGMLSDILGPSGLRQRPDALEPACAAVPELVRLGR